MIERVDLDKQHTEIMNGNLAEVEELPTSRVGDLVAALSGLIPGFGPKYLEENYALQDHSGNSATPTSPAAQELYPNGNAIDPEHEWWEVVEIYKANKCQYALFSIMDPQSYLYDSS